MEDAEFTRRLEDVLREQNTEADFLKLCALYRKGTPEQRERIRAGWTPKHRWKVPLTCDFPMKGGLPHDTRIASALIFASIENLRMDMRDTLVNVCVAYHCGAKLAVDIVGIFEEVAQMSTAEFAELLRGFLRRRPENRSLAAFGWKDCCTPERILYRWG